jgi:predicted enzyme related to lactoylglutathione lyase
MTVKYRSFVSLNFMSLQYQRTWMTIAPRNFDKSCDFYTQLLGQSPDRTMSRSDHIIYAEFDLIGLRLGLYQAKSDYPATPSTLSICFQVENLEAAIELVTSLGYPPPGEIMHPSHGREVYAFDPDDNRLILYQPN